MTTIVHQFELCRRDVSDRLEQPAVVEPVDPFERRELDLLKIAPRSRRKGRGIVLVTSMRSSVPVVVTR